MDLKQVKRLICVVVGCVMVASCCPHRMFCVGTNGIATYNRHTGQFELLWEYAEKPIQVVHDTIYVDSCKLSY